MSNCVQRITLGALLISPCAFGQESDQPLALPRHAPARVEAASSPSSVGAMMAYRSRHLELRQLTLRYPGGTSVVTTGYGWGRGWPMWGYSTSYLVQNPDIVQESWAVFQDQRRLTVPAALFALDRAEEAEALTRRIRGYRHASTGGYVVAGLGGIGLATALMGASVADNYAEYRNWSSLSTASALACGGGILAGWFLQSAAQRMRNDFEATQDASDLQRSIDARNQRSMEELGLTPSQAAAAPR